MRTIEVTLYTFEELSDEAKARAIEHAQNSGWYGDDWAGEWRESLEGFVAQFPVTARDWEVSVCSPSYCRMELHGFDETAELSGVRAWKWLVNNGYDKVRNIFSDRLIKVTEAVEGACPFTGFVGDCTLLDPLADFLKKPDNRTLAELFRDCGQAWAKAWAEDMEHQVTEEYVAENLEIGGYEFTEDGKLA